MNIDRRGISKLSEIFSRNARRSFIDDTIDDTREVRREGKSKIGETIGGRETEVRRFQKILGRADSCSSWRER